MLTLLMFSLFEVQMLGFLRPHLKEMHFSGARIMAKPHFLVRPVLNSPNSVIMLHFVKLLSAKKPIFSSLVLVGNGPYSWALFLNVEQISEGQGLVGMQISDGHNLIII